MIYGTQSPAGAKVDIKFVFCNLTKEDQKVLVALEIMRYDDIIILNCTENMNQGKTYTYFSSLPEMLNSTEGHRRRTITEDLYYGYVIPCGSMNPFHHYMSGMGYLVSWDIVEWVSVSEISRNHLEGSEDRVFGDWMPMGETREEQAHGEVGDVQLPGPADGLYA
ncbi:hypothetical protein CK203_112345 [Vitis vinifera]|uniref:Uncharacterized protein n=1 Tax=Vitis vinifera TaxID=29760 RepID=A0A438CEM5_VITVI|nr:hypothetical protein CK203_112345 [Vitis vinifera]